MALQIDEIVAAVNLGRGSWRWLRYTPNYPLLRKSPRSRLHLITSCRSEAVSSGCELTRPSWEQSCSGRHDCPEQIEILAITFYRPTSSGFPRQASSGIAPAGTSSFRLFTKRSR
jgi:hypothetical protein